MSHKHHNNKQHKPINNTSSSLNTSSPSNNELLDTINGAKAAADSALQFVNSNTGANDEIKQLISVLAQHLKITTAALEKHTAPKSPMEEYLHKHSVVISGVPESTEEKATDRAEEDKSSVCALLDTAGVECLPITVFRMGQLSEKHPRLLKVQLPTTQHVRTLLWNKTRLAKEIRIRRSMSREERDANKSLWDECTKRRTDTKLDYVVYAGRVIERSKIVKKQHSK